MSTVNRIRLAAAALTILAVLVMLLPFGPLWGLGLVILGGLSLYLARVEA